MTLTRGKKVMLLYMSSKQAWLTAYRYNRESCRDRWHTGWLGDTILFSRIDSHGYTDIESPEEMQHTFCIMRNDYSARHLADIKNIVVVLCDVNHTEADLDKIMHDDKHTLRQFYEKTAYSVFRKSLGLRVIALHVYGNDARFGADMSYSSGLIRKHDELVPTGFQSFVYDDIDLFDAAVMLDSEVRGAKVAAESHSRKIEKIRFKDVFADCCDMYKPDSPGSVVELVSEWISRKFCRATSSAKENMRAEKFGGIKQIVADYDALVCKILSFSDFSKDSFYLKDVTYGSKVISIKGCDSDGKEHDVTIPIEWLVLEGDALDCARRDYAHSGWKAINANRETLASEIEERELCEYERLKKKFEKQ